jgi:transposase-like protein
MSDQLAAPIHTEAIDAAGAADRYRRAQELLTRAKAELIAKTIAERGSVNVTGLSRRAGLWPQTLEKWIRAERTQNGRAHTNTR